MNFETRIRKDLWEFISVSYKKEEYTGAVKDSIYFLTDLIREKGNLTGDGSSLVGQAFGGSSPRIKINNLKTETEKNEQKGISEILRGIYSFVRNPRAHDKYSDTKENAESLISFINFLICVIDKSKTRFSVSKIMDRIFDESFVESDKYANLIINEIPQNKRFEVLVNTLERCIPEEQQYHQYYIDSSKLNYFIRNILLTLETEELKDIYDLISDKLRQTTDEYFIKIILLAFKENWEKLDEVARLRIENMLLNSLEKSNDYLFKNKEDFDVLILFIFDLISLKERFFKIVVKKVNSYDENQNCFAYEILFKYLSKSSIALDRIEPKIKRRLNDGDISTFIAVKEYFPKEWKSSLGDDFTGFKKKQKEEVKASDDLPF